MTGALIKIRRRLRHLFNRPVSDLDTFLTDASGVIHIGANSGQERDIYARQGLDVVWVEPIPEVFAELKQNITPLKRQRPFATS